VLNRVTNLVDLYRELGGGWIEHAGDQPRPSDAMPDYRDIGTPTAAAAPAAVVRRSVRLRTAGPCELVPVQHLVSGSQSRRLMPTGRQWDGRVRFYVVQS
jgi:multidrug efflux system outer membrane protein